MKNAFRCALVVVSLALGGVSCAQTKPAGAASAPVRAEYDKETGRLTRLESDRNGDGRPDTWGYIDRKSTRLNSSHIQKSRMPSSA